MAGKRGQGEGSIRRRNDGRWEARVTLAGGKRKSLFAKTRAEVAAKLAATLKANQDGLPIPSDRQTVGYFIQDWLENVARHTIRESTFETYETYTRVHILPALGKIILSRLTPQDLARLYSAMLEKGRSPATVQYVHAILHRSLDQAVRWNMIARNPADAVDPPRAKRTEIRPFDSDQVTWFLNVAKGDRLYALYVLAVTTGMREGELLGLKWADISFTTSTVHVRQQLVRTKAGFSFKEPKTARGRRTITLPTVATAALLQHRRDQNVERLKLGSAWEDLDLVFPNQVGRPMERQNLTRRSFEPLLKKAGLPSIRFHDLRHSSATLLLSQGIHPKVVQERLGHSTIAVTMDVYSHVMPTLQKEAADKLDAYFEAS